MTIKPFNSYLIENRNSILGIEYHSGLSRKLWKNDMLIPSLIKPLTNYAKEWMEFARLDMSAVTDVTLTGSICNYNYTSLSDIDLHIIVDHDKLPFKNRMWAHQYILDKMHDWKKEHDSKLVGFPVEIYAQGMDESVVAGGVYSVSQNKWLKHPKNLHLDFSHRSDLVAKVLEIAERIDTLQTQQEGLDLSDEIYDIRTKALAHGDEFSDGNLVYKSLRNRGDLDKLKEFNRAHQNI